MSFTPYEMSPSYLDEVLRRMEVYLHAVEDAMLRTTGGRTGEGWDGFQFSTFLRPIVQDKFVDAKKAEFMVASQRGGAANASADLEKQASLKSLVPVLPAMVSVSFVEVQHASLRHASASFGVICRHSMKQAYVLPEMVAV